MKQTHSICYFKLDNLFNIILEYKVYSNFAQMNDNFRQIIIQYNIQMNFGVITMYELNEGDAVTRKSYNNDIVFEIKKIYIKDDEKVAILHGITIRIEADSPISDLELIRKECEDRKLYNCRENFQVESRGNALLYTGKILHLDGDKRYSEKAFNYYKKIGLNAIVKNIPEYKQSLYVIALLDRYNPDILVVTGHDGMLKKGKGYNNINNYRNSKYFMNTVQKARNWENFTNNLVIFAGACQSYYEALISAGANFASSPGRIMIDFLDPIIVAQNVAITDRNRYITINDIEKQLRDGKLGINGIGARGKGIII